MSGSPIPRMSLMTSVAWITPTKTGKDAENATFRAAWDKSRGRRLWIQAAIAWTFFRRKHRGLALKAEDAAVGIWLSGKNAGVVDQVAGLEVVGAVSDDVVVLEDVEGVGAGQHGVVLHHVDVLVQALQHDLGGVDLELADGRLVNE